MSFRLFLFCLFISSFLYGVETDSLKRTNTPISEKLINLPLKTLFFPFNSVLYSTRWTIKTMDETMIVARIHDYMSSDEGKWEFLPVYSSRLGGGLKYKRYHLAKTSLDLSVSATVGLDLQHGFQIRLDSLKTDGGDFSFFVRYRYFQEEEFFGTGALSNVDDESNYDLSLFDVGIDWNKRIYGNLQWRLSLLASEVDYSFDDYFDASFPAKNEKRLCKEMSLRYNTLDHTLRPTTGILGALISEWSQSLDKGEKTKYYILKTDFKVYYELLKQRVLSFRLLVENARSYDGGLVPFFELPYLGSNKTLRGFKRGRFRDRDLVLTRTQYRYPISEKTDAMLFCDCGRVFYDLYRDFSRDHWSCSFGLGFRVYRDPDHLIFSVEAAVSKEDFKLFFKLNEF